MYTTEQKIELLKTSYLLVITEDLLDIEAGEYYISWLDDENVADLENSILHLENDSCGEMEIEISSIDINDPSVLLYRLMLVNPLINQN